MGPLVRFAPMPFTVSHAAAALPVHRLSKGLLPLPALMIGAMSPDFAYLVSFAANRMQTHTLPGLFTFCLPVGLAVWLLYLRLLEQPTVALLPDPWRSHFTRDPEPLHVRALLFASLGIVVGAMTHIAWDAFTHAYTPVTEIFPVLRTTLFEVHGVPVTLFWLLQILSSLFGGIVLLAWALRAPTKTAPLSPRAPKSECRISNPARIGAALAVLAPTLGVGFAGWLNHPFASFDGRLFFLLMGGMKGFVIGWAAIAVFVRRYLAAERHMANSLAVPPGL